MKKLFSVLLMLTACFLFVVTVSAATGNGTITYGDTPFELIEDTGTDVYATVRASSLPNGSVSVNAIMQKSSFFGGQISQMPLYQFKQLM